MDVIVTPTHTFRSCASLRCCQRCLFFANFSIAAAATLTLPVFLSWLAAHWQLGRAPLPAIDVPTQLSGLAGVAHGASEWVLPAMFGLFFAAAVVTLTFVYFLPRTHRRRAFVRLLLSLPVFAASLLVITLDPWRIFAWWLN